MKLSSLVAATKNVTVQYGGEAVHLVVRASAITSKLLADLALLAEAEGGKAIAAQVNEVPELLVRLVASWDVLTDDEQPFPLDAEQIAEQIPFDFQVACIRAATGSMGEASAPASGATSDATSPVPAK